MIGLRQVRRKAPNAVNALKAVPVAAGDNGLQSEFRGALEYEDVGACLSTFQSIRFDDQVGSDVPRFRGA